MANVSEVPLVIGSRRYRIRSDDTYLKAMRPGLSHRVEAALRQAVGANRFEPRMAELYAALIRPDDVALDVGANIGCTSILIAQLAKRVVAFEPVPKTFAFWQHNIDASGHRNCQCINVALGSESKSSQMNYSDANRSGAFVSDVVEGAGEGTTVGVRRLDDVAAELGLETIDFIKIDVEGYERKVIEGGQSTIARHRCVVQMELNSWCLNAMHRVALPDFFDFLLATFPIVYCIEKSHFADIRKTPVRWHVMHENIVHQRFKEMVVAFDRSRLERFHSLYKEMS